MNFKLSGSFEDISLGVEKLRTVFVVLQTAFYVSEDATVQAFVWVKLPVLP